MSFEIAINSTKLYLEYLKLSILNEMYILVSLSKRLTYYVIYKGEKAIES